MGHEESGQVFICLQPLWFSPILVIIMWITVISLLKIWKSLTIWSTDEAEGVDLITTSIYILQPSWKINRLCGGGDGSHVTHPQCLPVEPPLKPSLYWINVGPGANVGRGNATGGVGSTKCFKWKWNLGHLCLFLIGCSALIRHPAKPRG